ncbi:ABC transporter ATP-binding protein [Telmatocola sphagniphila]|jgi:lipoprotein-releasing system ATP-binding protein|uniref:ABC transporter ATP-binding protein n=1 Tax=Telmatocola sphagniphila TaxID=1123043 RepID=A0A8E6B2U6_9BACT|nr:ABC transporter ATP-binding protein [Telmatocola sphagniphila]QVL30066.1 ABC transporter ATP-binding protein [Telmatocola sphagniphila]
MLKATGLCKTYHRHADTVKVLTDLSLEVADNEFLSIVGASGSGKSTLLHLLGTLDKPDAGTIELNRKRIDDLNSRERDLLRNNTFGFIFQFYHLLPELTMLENVMMPALIKGSIFNWLGRRKDARRKAEAIIDRVGLSSRKKHRPRELSGGEMQRTAIARALVSDPQVLFADEPTGNLDEDTGNQIIELLKSINREQGVTILMVTHNLELVSKTDRVVKMAGGHIVSDTPKLTDRSLKFQGTSDEQPSLYQRQAV